VVISPRTSSLLKTKVGVLLKIEVHSLKGDEK